MGRGKTRRDSAHVTTKVEWCMHTMYLVCCSKGLSGQSTIFVDFFLPDIKKMAVVIYLYLKDSLEYIDSKYIWVQVFFIKYHFWHFKPYTGKGRGVTRWDPACVILRVKLYMRTNFFLGV